MVQLSVVLSCFVHLCRKKYYHVVEHMYENILRTRSTKRAQTSLAEADHYSHIVHCKNVEPWL